MHETIIPADRILRKRTILWDALLVAAGLAGICHLASYLDSLTILHLGDPQLAAKKYARLLFVFGIASVLIASTAGGLLGFIFCKALRAEQFPPPGIRQ